MTQRTPLQKNLEAASAQLESGNVKKALDALVAIRELGFTSRDLERNIGLLRDSPADTDTTQAWLEQILERVRAEGDDAFRAQPGLSERSMSNVVDGLFDDLDDIFGSPEKSFAAEATRRVEPILGADEGAPNLKDRLRLTSNKAKIPPPTKGTLSGLIDTKPGADAGDNAPRGRDETPVSSLAASREPARRPGFDSGVSGVRYASDFEPAPPVHRLKGADISIELARPSLSKLAEVSDDEDADLDFDLGFESPMPSFGRPKESAPAQQASDLDFDLGFESPKPVFAPSASAPAPDDDLDFDLGFESPVPSFSGPGTAASDIEARNNQSAIPAPAISDPNASTPGQTRPGDSREEVKKHVEVDEGPFAGLNLGEVSEPIDENEFFELAESMASEASAIPQAYRAESRPDVAHEQSSMSEELGSDESSVVGPGTNMSAIMLEARRMFERGDLNGALDICQKIISRQDGNAEAELLRATIEADLDRHNMQKLGSLTRVPRLAIAPSALAGLDLDHRAGFLLSQIDGFCSYEDLLDVASMPRQEALKLFVMLIEQGAIVAD